MTLAQSAAAVDVAAAEYAKQKGLGAYLAAVETTKSDLRAVEEQKGRLAEAKHRLEKDFAAQDLVASRLNQALDELIRTAQASKVPVLAGQPEVVVHV